MTASSPQKAPYRRSSKAEHAGVTLPTLFQIPPLHSGLSEGLQDETASDPPVDHEPHDPIIQQEIAPAKSESLADPIPADDAVRPLETVPPSPKPLYNDLASLPPLDEPTGRSWAEAVGSRLVLVLLFAAIATVAVLGTRDVPPTPGETQLAVDTTSSVDADEALPGGKEMRLAPLAPESVTFPGGVEDNTSAPTLAQDFQSDLIDVPYQAMALDTTNGTKAAASVPLESAEPNRPYPELSQVPPLPSFENTDGVAPDSSFPDAVSSNTSNESSSSASDQNVRDTAVVGDSDAALDSLTLGASEFGESELLDSDESSSSPASPDLPAYRTTSTPNAITDWSQYYRSSRTVGFQRSASPQTSGQILPSNQPSSTQPFDQQGSGQPLGSAPAITTGGAAPSHPAPGLSEPLINAPSGTPQNPQQSWQHQGANLQSPSGAAPYQPQAAYPRATGMPPYVQGPVYGQPTAPGYYPTGGQNPMPNVPPGDPSAVISAYPGQPIAQPR